MNATYANTILPAADQACEAIGRTVSGDVRGLFDPDRALVERCMR